MVQHYEKHRDVHTSLRIVRIMKSERLQRDAQVIMVGKIRNTRRIWFGNHLGIINTEDRL